MLKFTRQHRLKTQEFKNIFQNCRRLHNTSFTVLFDNDRALLPRLGVVVSKKQIPQAFARNKIKRLLRESFRLHQAELPNLDIVILVKKECLKSSNSEIFTILGKIWKKLQRDASVS